jgi:hypothetical protein
MGSGKGLVLGTDTSRAMEEYFNIAAAGSALPGGLDRTALNASRCTEFVERLHAEIVRLRWAAAPVVFPLDMSGVPTTFPLETKDGYPSSGRLARHMAGSAPDAALVLCVAGHDWTANRWALVRSLRAPAVLVVDLSQGKGSAPALGARPRVRPRGRGARRRLGPAGPAPVTGIQSGVGRTPCRRTPSPC